jgi:hypothetical protein
MKRMLVFALAAGALVVGMGTDLQAQEMGMMNRRASLFDLGVYAGGAYTTDWFEGRSVTPNQGVLTETDGEGYRIGLTPSFGANATFWGLRFAGLRLHYGYIPSELPQRDDDNGNDNDETNYVLNNHLYDLSLVLRVPGLPLVSSLVGNVYAWVGGGGLTVDIAGEDRRACEPRLLAAGACLSFETDHATVGQGVIGIGGDIVSLTNNIGLFVEVAAHGYDSPVHVGDDFVGPARVRTGQSVAVANDQFAVTTRFVAGLKLALGGGAREVVAPPPPPPPPPPPVVEAQPTAIRVCVVEAGALREVDAMVMPAGDTMVMMAGQQRRFADAFPATGYAATQDFFVQDRPVRFQNREYVRFGLSRIVTPADVNRVGEFMGVPVFAETGAPARSEVIYLPVRPGCEFQPYQLRQQVRARG